VGPKTFGTLEEARAAKKPLATLILADDEVRSYALLRALTDIDVPVVWARIPFAKDSEDCKRWKITAPGALALLDPTSDPPKLIKVLRAAAPAALKKELLDAAKKQM
jgi:hypothetical protein